MTYPALVRTRKQSVEDAETLFSPSLLKFMEKKGYKYEAKYIGAVLGWREACDKCGLTELERCRRNCAAEPYTGRMMPWSNDFSLFEVNWYVHINIMHDHIGANFTLKQAQFGWQKVCLEF